MEMSLALSESLRLGESAQIQLVVTGSEQTFWPGHAPLA